MQQTRFRIEFPGQRGPLQGWLAVLLAAVGFVVAMTLGVVFFLFFLALALVVAVVLDILVADPAIPDKTPMLAVDQVGEKVDVAWLDRDVLALTRFGGYSDVVCVPEAQVAARPAGMSAERLSSDRAKVA